MLRAHNSPRHEGGYIEFWWYRTMGASKNPHISPKLTDLTSPCFVTFLFIVDICHHCQPNASPSDINSVSSRSYTPLVAAACVHSTTIKIQLTLRTSNVMCYCTPSQQNSQHTMRFPGSPGFCLNTPPLVQAQYNRNPMTTVQTTFWFEGLAGIHAGGPWCRFSLIGFLPAQSVVHPSPVYSGST